MKKICTAIVIAAVLAGPSFAGGLSDATVAPPVVIADVENTSSASGIGLVALMAALLVLTPLGK